jgi:hypothetical protein
VKATSLSFTVLAVALSGEGNGPGFIPSSVLGILPSEG